MSEVLTRYATALACFRGASDYPLRCKLANEVHARPFLRIEAPARVIFLSVRGTRRRFQT